MNVLPRAAFALGFLLSLTGCASGDVRMSARNNATTLNPTCLSSDMDRTSNVRVGAAKVQPPECRDPGSAVLWTTEDEDDEPIDFRRKEDDER
jgi:hypothetical protein